MHPSLQQARRSMPMRILAAISLAQPGMPTVESGSAVLKILGILLSILMEHLPALEQTMVSAPQEIAAIATVEIVKGSQSSEIPCFASVNLVEIWHRIISRIGRRIIMITTGSIGFTLMIQVHF